MKKLLSLLLILSLLFSFTACFSAPEELEEDLALLEDILNAAVDGEQDILDEPQDEIGDTNATSQDADLAVDATETVSEGANSSEDEQGESTPAETKAPEEPTEYATLSPDELPPDFFIEEPEAVIDESGSYTTKEDVALYIHTYGKLPQNFITKNEARKLGWEGGSLEPYAPGKCIGGDRFGNYEGLLPTDRKYTECDIDTLGAKSRGAKRLVFSDDGLIYYTDDHYESFTLLYGEE